GRSKDSNCRCLIAAAKAHPAEELSAGTPRRMPSQRSSKILRRTQIAHPSACGRRTPVASQNEGRYGDSCGTPCPVGAVLWTVLMGQDRSFRRNLPTIKALRLE